MAFSSIAVQSVNLHWDNKVKKHSWTSRSVSDHPKCQAWWSLMIESLDHNVWKVFLIRIWYLPRLHPCANADAMFCSFKSRFREKNPVLPTEKFPFLALARNTIMFQHLIHFSLHYRSSGRLREVKNKGKFQIFTSKSGRGRLRGVSDIVNWLGNFWYFCNF